MTCLKEYNLNAVKKDRLTIPSTSSSQRNIHSVQAETREHYHVFCGKPQTRVMPKDYHLLLALSFSFSGGSSVRAHRAHAPSRFLAP